MSIQFHTTHNVPSYQDWFEDAVQDLGFDVHRRLLQHLQAKRPGNRWVLKAPGHLFALEGLLKRYPDARVIHTHRDPLRVMASMASHATVLRRAFSDRADPRQIAADWADRWARALDKFLAVRDRAPAEQFLDVDFDAIEEDPLATIERVYDFLGWRVTAEARTRDQCGSWRRTRRTSTACIATRSSSSDLSRAAETARFRGYCERFGIEIRSER